MKVVPELHCGDCIVVLKTLAENSIDSCVTDPPYHLISEDKRSVKRASGDPSQRDRVGGFMGMRWDGGDIAFQLDTWREVLRVLKPGGHMVAFGGTRTYHRMACAIEDAGFEVRDTLCWLYGTGFPKSHDVSKGIDKAAGAQRDIIWTWNIPGRGKRSEEQKYGLINDSGIYTAPATDSAYQWDGWGTALKPAFEPIILARKPLSEKTVAANVLLWGTGAINIDGCRVDVSPLDPNHSGPSVPYKNGIPLPTGHSKGRPVENLNFAGRWPANVCHDGSDEVIAAFPYSGPAKRRLRGEQHSGRHGGLGDLGENIKLGTNSIRGVEDDGGSAARFFYSAKADSDDRLGSKHPTIKPIDLMQYLVRMITPPNGTVIDPFAGTGTTGEAAFREGMSAILIERESEYQDDIRRRIKLMMSGYDERVRESIKQRMKCKPVDHGPLFGNCER